MTRPYVRRSAAQWKQIITRYEHSDQSQREFCLTEGISLATFLRWRRRLGAQAVAPPRRDVSSPSGDFVQLTAPSPQAGWSIELELPGGCTLRIRS